MTREEHLAWAKQRALEYLDKNDLPQAVTSMLSDLSKHGELKMTGEKMGDIALLYLMNRDVRSLRRWIEGFR